MGLRLRELRQRVGLTLPVVAEEVGISVSHLSDLERGRTLPSLPLLLRLADQYQLETTELLSGLYPFGSSQPPDEMPPPPTDGRTERYR